MLFLMLVSTAGSMRAGDIKNRGVINNTGTIRIGSGVTGLPLVNGGVYEFFGGDQTVPPMQYADLRLTGSGTKTIGTGEAVVSGTLTIASGVITETPSDTRIRLLGTMDEQGYLLGVVDKTQNLTGPSGSNAFGNIGATISWIGSAPGTTTVTRVTGAASTSSDPLFGTSQSIERYFDIAATFATGLNGTLVFKYDERELSGQDESTLSLWRSVDGGLTWRKQGGVPNPALNTITKTGIVNFSRWTASDASNPLGPPYIEGTAYDLALTSGNGQSATTGSALPSPFVVTVRDYYGTPIAGTVVTFSIVGTPAGATGQTLSATNVTTNASGQASTILTLGNAAGTYSISASSAGLVGSPVLFTATATTVGPPPPVPVATSIVQTAGNAQIDTVRRLLSDPLVVTVLNQFGTPFSGAQVRFSIVSTPTGATGQALTDTLVLTNALGQAATRLTLGSRAGEYRVQASSGSLTGSPITFTSTAVAGRPSVLALASGDNQTQEVRTTLVQPFVVAVTDSFANPVRGVTVRFAVTSVPSGAGGFALSDTLVATDAAGVAGTRLTLGDSVGVYEVTASSGTLQGSPLLFRANATAALGAVSIVMTAGNNQHGVVTTTLAQPFVVTVHNALGDPVAGVPVEFAIVDAPVGATGQALSVASVLTDSAGQASTRLTLGTKIGVYRVSATSAGLSGSPVLFIATAERGPAVSMALLGGSNQTGEVSTILSQPLAVSVFDIGGNGVAGVPVTFVIDSIPAGASGQAVNGAASVVVSTDSSGTAIVWLRLGTAVGIYRVTASAAGLAGSPVIFRASARESAAAIRLAYTAGDRQTAPILTELANPLVVTVLNEAGTPVPGQTVTFAVDSVPAGAFGYELLPGAVTTDESGRAFARLRLGSKTGTYRVAAALAGAAGSPIHFRLRAVHGAPAAMAQVSGDGQVKPVLSTLDSAFVVAVTDAGGNPVPGAAVEFAFGAVPAGAAGHRFVSESAQTDSLGRAFALTALGNRPGTYEVLASAPGLLGSPVRFVARAVTGAPVAMFLAAGDNQSGFVSTELSVPFSVRILDIGGNPVPGVLVVFAIDSVPDGSSGQQLRILNDRTDAAGEASAVLKLGDRVGRYVVTASVSGLSGSPVRFAAFARILVGDVNSDMEINIADLTSVIDHILGRVTLTHNDSAKADINADGRISVADIVLIHRHLLALPAPGITLSVGGGSEEGMRAALSVGVSADSGRVRGEFVATSNGLRFVMANAVPVKGVQIVLRLRNPIGSITPDVIFPRAEKDSFYVNSLGRELRIVGYNLENEPILPGEGPIFRLPLKLTDIEEIEGGEVIISTSDPERVYDQALKGPLQRRVASPTEIPLAFVLYQNYPNPFNAGTKIDYEVPDVEGRSVRVLIQIFSLLGERVKQLAGGEHAGGRYTVYWDGTDDNGSRVPSGTYYYRLVSGDFQSAKKMILLR